MNGRNTLLILAHLFRKKGETVEVEKAVEYLSFRCRFGRPSTIRKMLTAALEHNMIKREADVLHVDFLYDRQVLPHTLTSDLQDKISVEADLDEMV
jgi:hypothetical protein